MLQVVFVIIILIITAIVAGIFRRDLQQCLERRREDGTVVTSLMSGEMYDREGSSAFRILYGVCL